MSITRREFLKYCISSAAAIGLGESMVSTLKKAFAGEINVPTVIWIEGSSCSGCSISMANLIGDCSDSGPVDFNDLLTNYANLAFSKTFMSAAGDMAVSSLREAQQKDYILVVEGGIPTAFNGKACTVFTENGADVTMMDAVLELAPGAVSVICAGTCSSFGGIPASSPNPINVVSVSALTGIQTINLPGCPVHPDWIAATIASLMCGNVPDLDASGRPVAIYGASIHDKCPRKPMYDSGSFAVKFGQEGTCLYKMGCNGPTSYADCPRRGWNNGLNYCIQSNGNCIGCVESSFPKPQLLFKGTRSS